MIERYSRKEMRDLWSEDSKYNFWGLVEKAHLETLVEQEKAPSKVLKEFAHAISTKTAKDFLTREQETGHDVIAFIAELGDAMKSETDVLHKGLTSSDVVDTALALRIKCALGILERSLQDILIAIRTQAQKHKHTLCMGRTHGIHAEPISFGQVLASHYAEFERAYTETLAAKEHISFGKLSGAVGNYTQLDPSFEAAVLKKLDLEIEPVSTQIIPRDRILTIGKALLSSSNAIERFATNMRHWARTELGEVLEPFGKRQKGSSAMPHKKNPILSENLCGLARTIRGYFTMLMENGALWHERDISHSSVERIALPDMFITLDFMLFRTTNMIKNMNVNEKMLEAQIWKTGGLWASQNVLTALIEKGVNRIEAYECVQSIALFLHTELTQNGKTLSEISLNKASLCAFADLLQKNDFIQNHLSTDEVLNAFELKKYLKHVDVVFKRVFND